MVNTNDASNESGKGTMYKNVARSAYCHALANPMTRTLLLVPEAAFLHCNRKVVETLASLLPDQVRERIVHHSVPVVQEAEFDSLSTIFQLAHHCNEQGILVDLASMHLSIKSDKYWVHASIVTKQVNEMLKLKKENHLLARRLKKAIDAYRRNGDLTEKETAATTSAETSEVDEETEDSAYDPLDACMEEPETE